MKVFSYVQELHQTLQWSFCGDEVSPQAMWDIVPYVVYPLSRD